MTNKDILASTIVAPEKAKRAKVEKKLLAKIQEESQVVVHCTLKGSIYGELVRIWKTTYLFPHNSSHRSKLIHAENIDLYPVWTRVNSGCDHVFSLFFTALPKDCTSFDLVEVIPEPGGFKFTNIPRNKTDVYHIEI